MCCGFVFELATVQRSEMHGSAMHYIPLKRENNSYYIRMPYKKQAVIRFQLI